GIYSFLSGEEGAVTVAMLMGDKSGISYETNNAFSLSGISHLFAVSGLHLSVWIMSLYILIKKFTKRRGAPEIISIVFTLFFVVLTGFTVSVCRAGLMLALVLISKIIDEDNDSFNSLGIALFVILLVNPMAAVSVSLLLSFSATLGIITAFPPVERKINEILYTVKNKRVKEIIKYFISLAAISFCASLFTLPITSFFIGRVSIIAPLTNMLVSLAATTQMIFGGVTSLFLPLRFIVRTCALLCGILAKYVIFVSGFLSEIPFCSVETDSTYFRVSLIIIISGFICVAMLIKNPKKRLISFISIVLSVSVVSTFAYLFSGDKSTSVRVYNTEGMTVSISHGSHNAILGCGGSERYPQDNLSFENLKNTELLLLPDRSENNSSMYMYFIENCNPEIIVSGEENQSVELMRNDCKISPNFEYIPWNNSLLKFMKKGKDAFAKFTENDTEILIIFSLSDVEKIPEEFLNSDIIITSDSVPEDLDFSVYDGVIVSASKKKTEKALSNINSNNVLTVCSYADVEISLNKNNEVKYYYDER
ncbi:MAG: ComEC/Rec2 family competence protein, partial [Clostridia bacterium]|nr:ComEC/Rec2 family competence protein [Clostridia bacterium]